MLASVGDVLAVSWRTVDQLMADMCQLVIKYTFTVYTTCIAEYMTGVNLSLFCKKTEDTQNTICTVLTKQNHKSVQVNATLQNQLDMHTDLQRVTQLTHKSAYKLMA